LDENVLEFTVFCIENTAEALGMSGDVVYGLLNKSRILDDYIIPAYDVLHTQGKEYLVDDITGLMRKKGLLQ
jgi:hypothetical protein